MTTASSEAERNKMNLQLKLFTEQMDYQLWQDGRLHDNACIANDNTKLAIEKQSELILCLSQLSSVFSSGCCGTSDMGVFSQSLVVPPMTSCLPTNIEKGRDVNGRFSYKYCSCFLGFPDVIPSALFITCGLQVAFKLALN